MSYVKNVLNRLEILGWSIGDLYSNLDIDRSKPDAFINAESFEDASLIIGLLDEIIFKKRTSKKTSYENDEDLSMQLKWHYTILDQLRLSQKNLEDKLKKHFSFKIYVEDNNWEEIQVKSYEDSYSISLKKIIGLIDDNPELLIDFNKFKKICDY